MLAPEFNPLSFMRRRNAFPLEQLQCFISFRGCYMYIIQTQGPSFGAQFSLGSPLCAYTGSAHGTLGKLFEQCLLDRRIEKFITTTVVQEKMQNYYTPVHNKNEVIKHLTFRSVQILVCETHILMCTTEQDNAFEPESGSSCQ